MRKVWKYNKNSFSKMHVTDDMKRDRRFIAAAQNKSGKSSSWGQSRRLGRLIFQMQQEQCAIQACRYKVLEDVRKFPFVK